MPAVKSLDEAAELLGLGRRTLQRWISNGRLTAYRIAGDRRRFVDPDEVRRLQEPQPAPPRKRPGVDPR